MKFFFTQILAVLFVLPLFSCISSTPGNADLTIGIWNEFPDTPNYIKKKTLVFRHKVYGYDTKSFKRMLTQTAREDLISKGYQVIEVQDRTPLTQGRADMIVQILPLDISKQDGTLGYGFYDRKILGFLIKQPARAYVCMNMVLHKKDSIKVKRTGRQDNFLRLDLAELPDSPDQLTQEQTKQLSLTLETGIRKSVLNGLEILGL